MNGVNEDYLSPTSFFEFDGTTITAAGDPPDSDHTPISDAAAATDRRRCTCAADDTSFYAYTVRRAAGRVAAGDPDVPGDDRARQHDPTRHAVQRTVASGGRTT